MYQDPDDYLREMLHLWLNLANPAPTRVILASAVEPYSPAISQTIQSDFSWLPEKYKGG